MADYGKRRKKGDEDDLSIESKPLPPEKQDDQEFVADVRQWAVETAGFWQENHDAAEQDVDFIEGKNHWPATLVEERDEPCLVLNRMPVLVERVCGEQRQNKQAIHVVPNDDHSAELEFEGPDGKPLKAHVALEGIIRTIEFNSNAEAHYDLAHQHAAEGGIGWLRVLTRYANGKDFDQEILIRSVRNRWSVLTDADAQEPDISDMGRALISSSMLRKEFDRRYPKAMIGELADDATRRFWYPQQDRVVVSEYMCREPEERELLLLSNGQLGYRDELADILKGDGLVDTKGRPVQVDESGQVHVIRKRKVIDWCTYWRKMTAHSVLEGPVKMPFSTIPLVPVFGRQRDFRDGSTMYSGLVRHAKDSQRMENYWMSAATSAVALAPKAPWSGPYSAFEGLERFWDRANIDRQSYLPWNDDAPAPPVRVEPARMPVAEVAIAAQMGDRTKAIVGIHDASLGAESNEKSGRAIMARDRQSSTTTYIFGDNLGRAVRRLGLLIVEAIPRVYDTDRKVAMSNEDGTSQWLRVNYAKPMTDQQGAPVLENGKQRMQVVNSLSSGSFNVRVQPGPSFVTQRQEAAEGQMGVLSAAPDTVQIIGADVMRTQDWPGADRMAKRMMRAMDPKLLTKQEREELSQEFDDGQETDPATGQPMQDPAQQAQAAQMQVLQKQLAAQAAEAQSKQQVAEMQVVEADAKRQATIARAKADMLEAQVRELELRQRAQVAMQPPQPKPNGPEARE